MTTAQVLAVFKITPMVLIVESAEGTVYELSLADLHGAGHRFSADACTSFIGAYQLFYLPTDSRLV